MKQIYDSVGEEFLRVALDAQFVQLPKHRLALIVFAQVFLRRSALVVLCRLELAYGFQRYTSVDLVHFYRELVLDALHLNLSSSSTTNSKHSLSDPAACS
jgi:hypothetical protein